MSTFLRFFCSTQNRLKQQFAKNDCDPNKFQLSRVETAQNRNLFINLYLPSTSFRNCGSICAICINFSL